jgi:hypothetical protein
VLLHADKTQQQAAIIAKHHKHQQYDARLLSNATHMAAFEKWQVRSYATRSKGYRSKVPALFAVQ